MWPFQKINHHYRTSIRYSLLRSITVIFTSLQTKCLLFRQHSEMFTSQTINNSLSLNKGNHDRDGVWISDLNWHKFLRFHFSVFSLVLVSIEKIYQTFKTLFDHISKHLEVRQKYSATRCSLNWSLGI